MNSSVKATIDTYDEIAPDYLARRQDRTKLRPLFDRFALHLRPGSQVLDIGCGPGFDSTILRQYGFRVFSFDLSWGMMQTGRAEFPGDFAQADMRHLPLAPACADGLWLNASLLHLPRPEVLPTLQKMREVLRPRGILFLTVKGGTGEQWTAYPAATSRTRFFTYWPADELDHTLHQAGFTILEPWQDEANSQIWLGRIAQRAHTVPGKG
jgi:SAM-dependent methyltransferase